MLRKAIELNTIHCGDNVEAMLSMEPNTVDLIVTSPPYDDLREYGGHSWDFPGVSWLMHRVLKPGGQLVWIIKDKCADGNTTNTSFKQIQHFQSLGLLHRETLIWSKPWSNYGDTASRYADVHEPMFVLSKGKASTINIIRDRENVNAGNKLSVRSDRRVTGDKSGTERSDGYVVHETGPRKAIWEIPIQTKPVVVNGISHPAVFPHKLAADLIRSYSNEGDLVLDPFSGSGTTALAARDMGRNFIGLEINPDYCAIAEDLLSQQLLPFDEN